MGSVQIDDKQLTVDRAELTFYHCEGSVADWNLQLFHGDDTTWVAGTAEPAPSEPGDLTGSRLRFNLRDLSALLGIPLGHSITIYPETPDNAVYFEVERAGDAFQLTSEFEFTWDTYLDPPDADYEAPRRARIELVAGVAAFHPSSLP